MNLRDKKGSISIFVLVMLLFMSAFLIISFAANINKGKSVREQFNIISGIYSYGGGDEGAYEKAFTNLRDRTKRTVTEYVIDNSTIELEKTFLEKPSNLKIYGSGNKYQLLDFITSTGEQYIDTGVKIKDTYTIEAEIDPLDKGGFFYWGVGNYQQYGSGYNLFVVNSSGKSQWGNSSNTFYYKDLTHGAWNTIKQNKEGVFVNDEKKCEFSPESTLGEAQNTLWVFKTNPLNSAYNSGSIKMRSFKIYDENNNLIRSLLPCYRKSDGEIGMYDLVEHIFYTNKGTDKFIGGNSTGEEYENNSGMGDLVTVDENIGKYKIGIKISNERGENEIKYIFLDEPLLEKAYIDFNSKRVYRADGTQESIELPDLYLYEDYTKIEILTQKEPSKIEVEYKKYGYRLPLVYQEVDFIQSTGGQYIDTGVNIKGTYTIEAEIDPLDKGGFFYWGVGNYQQYGSGYNLIAVNSSGKSQWGNSSNTFYYRYLTPENWNSIKQNREGVFVNNEKKCEFSPKTTFDEIQGTLWIFKTNPLNSAYNSGSIKIRSFKIYDENNNLIRDLLPCYSTKSTTDANGKECPNGTIGLYDLVEGKFYTNAGTGKFLKGENILKYEY